MHDVLLQHLLDQALVEPVVSYEFADAVGDDDARKAIRLGAGQFFDRVFVVIADILSKCRLFVESGLFPFRAVGVAPVVRAFMPCL